MKKVIEITTEQAKSLYGKDEAWNAILRANFSGSELGINIMDLLDSFEAALEINGETIEEFNKRTEHDDDQERAGKELAAIYKAIRQGNEDGRYYPYFNNPNRSGSGSGFSFDAYGYVCVYSFVGARLTADTAEKATFVGKKFTSIYQRYING